MLSFLFILSFSALLSVNYLKDFSLANAILLSLDYYIPIACTILFLGFILPNTYSKNKLFNVGFIYSLLIIIGLFALKEVALPMVKPHSAIVSTITAETPYRVVLKEFDTINTLPQKTGVVLQNNDLSFVFGTIAQQNTNSYLLNNVFFKAKYGLSLYAEYAKVINKQIILYHGVVSSNNSPLEKTLKNYVLPLPFDVESLFKLWNTTDTKQIELLPIILNNLFNNPMLEIILLAFAEYLIGFICLLVICILGSSIHISLSFTPISIIGYAAALICSYPFVLLIYEYIGLIIQTIIKNIL